MQEPLLPCAFSRSLMCCRLQPVSSLLSSDSCWYESSRLCAFVRSLGLPETQQDAVLPISALPEGRGWRLEPGSGSDRSPDPTDAKPPVSTIPGAHSSVPPATGRGDVGLSPGMDCVTPGGGPVDVRRPLLAPLRQTWQGGTELLLPTGSRILLGLCGCCQDRQGGGDKSQETVPVQAAEQAGRAGAKTEKQRQRMMMSGH